MKNTKFVLKLALILFTIAFVCSLLLILCNNLTKDTIAEYQLKSEAQARSEVLPQAESFEMTDEIKTQLMLLSDSTVISCFEGKDKDGQPAGYCVNVQPSGFGGKISMTVGIDADGNVSGVKITSLSETPGLGAKADDSKWLSQYIGKGGGISVVKTGNAKENEINAISGATITSKAVTEGVNSAVNAASIFKNISEKEGK